MGQACLSVRQQLELLYVTGRELADGSDWPAWYSDSPFRAAREAQRHGVN